jgi:hypothetical protein
MEEARRKILAGSSLKEACFDLGYKQASHFTRVFKGHYGFPPSSLSVTRQRQLPFTGSLRWFSKKLIKTIAHSSTGPKLTTVGKEREKLESAIKANAAFIRSLRVIAASIRENAVAANNAARRSLLDSKTARKVLLDGSVWFWISVPPPSQKSHSASRPEVFPCRPHQKYGPGYLPHIESCERLEVPGAKHPRVY